MSETDQSDLIYDIAIIGMSCRFPKAAGLAEFWKLLEDGADAISEIPKERWDVGAYYDPDPTQPGKMSTRWGGFIDGIDQFVFREILVDRLVCVFRKGHPRAPKRKLDLATYLSFEHVTVGN